MKRRNLLKGMILACAAPAIIKAEILMPVKSIVISDDPWNHMSFSVEKTVVNAPTRMLRARYTTEISDDLIILHSDFALKELSDIVADEILKDRIMTMIGLS